MEATPQPRDENDLFLLFGPGVGHRVGRWGRVPEVRTNQQSSRIAADPSWSRRGTDLPDVRGLVAAGARMSGVQSQVMSIVGWQKHYENNRSRDLKRPEWLPLPNSFDGRGYMELCDHPAGMSHYGAWCMLLAAASRMPIRGLLVSDSGHPLTLKDVARMTRGSLRVFAEALPRLVEIGWIEMLEEEKARKIASNNAAAGSSTDDRDGTNKDAMLQEGAGIPHPSRTILPLKGKWNRNKNSSGSGGGPPPDDPPPPPDPEDITTPPQPAAAPSPHGLPARDFRSLTLGDFEASHPILLVYREDRDRAQTLFLLYGWELLHEGIVELTPIARARPPNKRRVLVSEIANWLGNNCKLLAQDYRNAGLPVPPGTQETANGPA